MPPLRVIEKVKVSDEDRTALRAIDELNVSASALLHLIPYTDIRESRWRSHKYISRQAFYRTDGQDDSQMTCAWLQGDEKVMRLHTGLALVDEDGQAHFPRLAEDLNDYKFRWVRGNRERFMFHPALWSGSPVAREAMLRAGVETLELIALASHVNVKRIGETQLLQTPASGNKGAEM